MIMVKLFTRSMNSKIFISKKEKKEFFLNEFNKQLIHHQRKSKEFSKIYKALFNSSSKYKNINNLPFIHIGLFKNYELISTKKTNIKKIMTSSGTTSSKKSKIFLDKENALIQTKILLDIGKYFIPFRKGNMLVLDSRSNTSDKTNFNARAAGIFGFSAFATNTYFCLDNNKFNSFLSNSTEKDFFFGFTDTVWKLLHSKNIKHQKFFSNKILLHGGGWKKLQYLQISKDIFNSYLYKKYKFKKIINYYGMIEQTGSIFFECKYGFFHTSKYNDIIIRGKNLEVLKNNYKGLVQLISLLPKSYPGNSILTEDLGIIHGEDNCKCGNFGKYFTIEGRIQNSDVRGCSNV